MQNAVRSASGGDLDCHDHLNFNAKELCGIIWRITSKVALEAMASWE